MLCIRVSSFASPSPVTVLLATTFHDYKERMDDSYSKKQCELNHVNHKYTGNKEKYSQENVQA